MKKKSYKTIIILNNNNNKKKTSRCVFLQWQSLFEIISGLNQKLQKSLFFVFFTFAFCGLCVCESDYTGHALCLCSYLMKFRRLTHNLGKITAQ